MKDLEQKPFIPSPQVKKAGALGKGIGSLIRDIDDYGKDAQNQNHEGSNAISYQPLMISVDLIKINPRQPRKIFDKKRLEELATSIANDGIIQPLVVSEVAGDQSSLAKEKYLLVAGERRLRAAKLAGLLHVPVVVKNIANEDLLRIALIENIQRADLNVIEEALAIKTLIEELRLTQEQCAIKLGKDRTTVTNILRLLNLPEEVQNDLVGEKLTMGHARSFLALESKQKILKARNFVIENELNVRQTEILVKKLQKQEQEDLNPQKPKEDKTNPNLNYIAEKIRAKLKTKVAFNGTAQKGQIVISYFSLEDFERISELIS